ncbi:hypothetical protein FQZ97_699330 [compost metagenome]
MGITKSAQQPGGPLVQVHDLDLLQLLRRTQQLQMLTNVLSKGFRKGGEQHWTPRHLGILTSQSCGTMHSDHSLTSASTTSDLHRTIPVTLDQLALTGMQEYSPTLQRSRQ